MKLSILIPTIPAHEENRKKLSQELTRQIVELDITTQVEICVCPQVGKETTGAKRNYLLSIATGDYVQFLDADDWVSEDYIKHTMEGIEKNVDCVSLLGIMTTDGENPEVFEHSIKYKEWKTNGLIVSGKPKYERYPNHLNAIRSSIAKAFMFPDITIGEDHKWSEMVFVSGLLKTEYYVPEVTYFYRYISKK